MNCLAFEALLDEGSPDRLPGPALEHADECASCARSLERARALEAALERHFAPLTGEHAPHLSADFTDRVMARVERVEIRGVRWPVLPDLLPWWVRAAAEPSVALACAVAALLLWRGGALLGAVRAWLAPGGVGSTWLASLARDAGLDTAVRALWTVLAPVTGPDWAVIAGVMLGVAPLLGLIGWAMWRAGERLAGAAPLPAVR